ncbi:MAG: trimethylamine methyltransferase family protein, partial [Eubacteriales bacterium]
MKSGYVANRSTRFSVLSDEQCRDIVSASKEILERTGVKLFYQDAVEILRKAGCSVDGEQVRIPSRLVDQALRMVPKRVTLCNSRTGERVMHLEGYNAYFGTGSDTPFYIDPYSGERRPSSTQSVGNNCRVIDALPNLDFVMSLGISQDVPQPVYDRYQYEAMVLNTSKPIVVTANDAQGFADIIEMAEIVAGGPEKLRRNPLIVLYAEPISPLQHSMESITKLMMAANKEVPVVYTPCVMAGATVPATMAGTLACGLAESLSGLVLHQLTKEGAPFIMGGVFTIMDMQSTIFSYGAPEFHLLEAALADIAHYLNLPMFGTCGCSDSKVA